MIHVSAGIVFDREGRILICKRGEGRKNAHLWEFPGGKREAGESAESCLLRELKEELSLPVSEVAFYTEAQHDGIHFSFLTAKTEAAPIPTEHEDVRFVHRRELLQYPFCPADVNAARMLAFAGIRHAFWDFDGTLLDSYPAMVRAFVAAAADYGIAVTEERALRLMKENLRFCCEVVGGENSIPAEELIAAFRRHEQGELQRGLPPVAGIPEVLETLHQRGVQHYVATHRDLQCRALLEKAGLAGYFDGYVTQEDGLPRKPAPDMLAHLMQRHDLDPAQCVMIGDRPLDTEAGMNAGVFSVLLDMEGRFPEGRCSLRIASANELPDFIL